jgi:hypothetical protein
VATSLRVAEPEQSPGLLEAILGGITRSIFGS